MYSNCAASVVDMCHAVLRTHAGQPLLDSTLARVRSMDLVEQAMLVRKLDQQGRVVGRVPWLKALRTTVGRIFGSAGATQDQQRGGGGRGSG
jgi:hypothetical protein